MKIYATAYKWEPEFQYTSESIDCSFLSLDEVINVMGEGFIERGKRFVIYGDSFNRTVFSDFKFN